VNILYHFRTRGTGAEAVHIAGIVRAFEKMGHRVILSSPTGIDPRETAGASPFVDRGGGGLVKWMARLTRMMPRVLFELAEVAYNVPAYLRNLRLARANGCGMIFERHAFFLFSTALIARQMKCPLVVEVNELAGDARIRAQPVLGPLARWADRLVFRTARLIVVVSPHLKRRVVGYGVPEERVLVLPNAVSEEELNPAGGDGEPELRLPRPGFMLGFAGWLVEWHRLDFIIGALACPEFREVVLVIIGEGPLRAELEAQAKAAGVRVHFAGALPHSQIPAAVRELDACVVPHSNEYRSPIKLFEFMAQGRAVLAPATEPISSVVKDGEDALLFTPLDEESFRAALRKLLQDSGLKESLGRRARAAVEERHTWERNAARIMENPDLTA
jgi:glycosyltransferase involved in cell wall biosynthesis